MKAFLCSLSVNLRKHAGKEKAINIKQAKMSPATTWMDLEDIMLGEISQTKTKTNIA